MWLYLIIFSIPFITYILGEETNRNKIFLIVYTTFLALFVGMSDMFGGYDRYIYCELFDSTADDITNGLSYSAIDALSYYEIGYSFLTFLIALVTENRYIFILILTSIIYFNIYKTFEKHFKNYPFAFILFLGMTFFFTFTYLRQVLAFSFAWLSIRYLVEGKRNIFFLMVLLVALIHKSGIVFATLYFIPLRKWTPLQILAFLFLCAIIGLSGVTSNLYDAFIEVTDVEAANEYSAEGTTRIAYALEVLFFIVIILNNYDKIGSNRENFIFLNMAWCFCAFLLLFIRSSDGGRVAWYFTIGIIYTITTVTTTPSTNMWEEVKNNTGPLIIIVMLALYIRVYNSWQIGYMLYPYKTFLTDEVRNPDPIWERYEYDHNYDNDKFYRPAFRFLKKSIQDPSSKQNNE